MNQDIIIVIGKINDIFASKGLTEYTYTKNNDDGMKKTLEYQMTMIYNHLRLVPDTNNC